MTAADANTRKRRGISPFRWFARKARWSGPFAATMSPTYDAIERKEIQTMQPRPVEVPAAPGFTLIEVMITVAVIAILAAVALPAYFDYITRSRLVEAKTNLVDMRTRLEQYFLDNRTYPAECIAAAAGPAPAGKIYRPATEKFFTISCAFVVGPPAQYTVTATGTGSMTGFVFTIDQTNARKTTAAKSGWPTSTVCWISGKSGC